MLADNSNTIKQVLGKRSAVGSSKDYEDYWKTIGTLQPVKRKSRLEIDKENALEARMAEIAEQASKKKGLVVKLNDL